MKIKIICIKEARVIFFNTNLKNIPYIMYLIKEFIDKV